MQVQIRRGSVVEAPADAIVNAANSQLVHAGGLARAIADVAGPELEAESARIADVPTGTRSSSPRRSRSRPSARPGRRRPR